MDRRRFLKLSFIVAGSGLLAACTPSATPTQTAGAPSPAATAPTSSATGSTPAATAAGSTPAVATTAASQPTAAPTARVQQLEQTRGKLVLINGLFENCFTWMSLEKGFYEQVGLDIEFQEIASGAVIQSALFNGEADVVELGYTLMAVPIERGQPIRIIGAPRPRTNLLFYAKKEINSVADLVGKNIGTSQPGAPLYVSVQALLEKYGVDPTQVNLQNLGGQVSAVMQALQVGTVDAGPGGPEYLPQIEQSPDIKVLYTLADELPDFVYVVLGATERTIREKPNFLAAFLTAYSRGIRYAIENQDEAIDVAAKYFPRPREEVASIFDWYIRNRFMRPDLDVLPDEHMRAQQFMVDLGLLTQVTPYEQVIDLGAQRRMIEQLGRYTYPA